MKVGMGLGDGPSESLLLGFGDTPWKSLEKIKLQTKFMIYYFNYLVCRNQINSSKNVGCSNRTRIARLIAYAVAKIINHKLSLEN